MIVIVSGNIGSGKSFVGELFKEKGANVIEADEIGHELLGEVNGELAEAFGKSILEDGEVSRKKLAEVAFRSEENLRILNGVFHPLLIKKIKERIEKDKVNVVVAALYHELKLDGIKDVTVLVKCDNDAIEKRAESSFFLKRQKYIKEVKDYDYIINNNRSREETRKQVEGIWEKLK